MQKSRYIIFEIAKNDCALPYSEIREILPTALLSRPPGMPSMMEGFLNLGGQVVPVISLGHLFDIGETISPLYAHLLILTHQEGNSVGLLVDYVKDILELPIDSLQPIKVNHSLNDCILGQILFEGKTIHLLSKEKILLKEEQVRIKHLTLMEQERLNHLEGATS